MFWLIGTASALRNFLTLTTLGGSTRVFQRILDLLVFGGLGDLDKFRGRPGPQTGQKAKKWIFPVLGAILGETPADQV